MQEVFNIAKNSWFFGGSEDLNIIEKFIKIIIIFIIIKIVTRISYVLIERFFKKQQDLKVSIEERKANTLSNILKSLCKYTFYFIGSVPILDTFGIKATSVIATAGVGGLAIGFGAQSLVKDIITGFFILFEDQFSVGDYVEVKGFEGVVEELGIRATRIRAFSGDLHIIPNGNIDIVTNKSRGDMRALVDVRIDYKEDIDRSINALESVGREMLDDEAITCGPTVLGVTKLEKDDIVISIMAMTKPMEQWAVERKLRKLIKEEFEKQDIPINNSQKIVLKSTD